MDAAQAPIQLEKFVLHLKTLRPEDVGNYIGTKGIHIKRLLKEKKGSKITMGKEEGHVKIEIEALKDDLEEIKDRLLQREALVNQARRQHDEQVSLVVFTQLFFIYNINIHVLIIFYQNYTFICGDMNVCTILSETLLWMGSSGWYDKSCRS